MASTSKNRLPLDNVRDVPSKQCFQIADERLAALESRIIGGSLPCTSFVAPSTGYSDITNLQRQVLTVRGNPVFLGLQWAQGQGTYLCQILNNTNAGALGAKGSVQFLRNGIVVGTPTIKQVIAAGATQINLQLSPGEFWAYDIVPTGQYVYTVQAKSGDANSVFTLSGIQLIAFEL